MMKVTFNIARETYMLYKKNLRDMGKIPTYDLVNHIISINKEAEERNKEK